MVMVQLCLEALLIAAPDRIGDGYLGMMGLAQRFFKLEGSAAIRQEAMSCFSCR
jgi:hypothetical protein